MAEGGDDYVHNVIITNASVDLPTTTVGDVVHENKLAVLDEECAEAHGLVSPACVSPASSNGGVYSVNDLFSSVSEVEIKR